jgi:type IV pilus assembly protein PilC
MAKFGYTARNEAGASVTATIEAADEQAALETLWRKNLLIINLWQDNEKKRFLPKRRHQVCQRELMVFTRQFATMLKAGLPIVQALRALGRQTGGGTLGAVVNHVATTVERGLSLSEALVLHPRAFNNLYVSMVQAGETGGTLSEILERAATYLESSERLRKKIKGALAYPVIVCVIAMSISMFLIIKIIPMFKDIYRDLGSQLPGPTQILIQVSDFVRHYAVPCALACAIAVFLLRQLKRTKRGQVVWDKYKLRLPILGSLVQKIVLSRLVRTCAALLRSGVPILETLRIGGKSGGNVVFEAALVKATTAIEQGQTLTEAMYRDPLYPPMLVEMVAAGEQTGHVPEMLEQVATYYDVEIESSLNELTSLIEPLLMVFLGVVVGTIVICMFLPIFKISQAVQF